MSWSTHLRHVVWSLNVGIPERLHLFQASWIMTEAKGVRELQKLVLKMKDSGPWPFLGHFSFFLLDCLEFYTPLGGSLTQNGPTREFKQNSALATRIFLLA